MPRINLLPIKAAQRQVTARNEMFAMAGLVVAAFGSLFLWYTNVEVDIGSVRDKIRALDADIGKLTEEVKKVEDLQKKEKKVQKKLGVIKKLYSNRAGPARMLHEIATIMTTESKRVWLTHLAHKGNGELALKGGAMDHEDISEFQLALERRETFHKVRLKRVTTQKQKKDEAQHLTWELTCTTRFKS